MFDNAYSAVPTHRLLLLTGLPRATIAPALGVTLRTLERYARGAPVPAAARRLLEVFAGWMPWAGFERCQVTRGAVYVADLADGLTPAEMAAAWWQRQRADALARELAQLKAVPAQFLLDLPPPHWSGTSGTPSAP
ncbi:MAG: hypothetical protein K2Y51_09260 [Gammaproteobacteria bacterium]|nr:hypothetical protein [Gammaproteobacteria bacterium]